METLAAPLSLFEGNHRPPVYSRHKGTVMRGLDVLFDISLNKLLTKNM